MDKTQYIWHNGKIVPWEQAQVHVLTHTLHYGAGAFEGLRAYETDRGPAIFRLNEHIERLFYSTGAIKMTIPYTQEQLAAATVELFKVNKLPDGYIRPLVYYGAGVMGLNPRNSPVEVAIACWPWGKYLGDLIDVKSSSYIRIHPKSTVADAKICGHYVNSILAVQELRDTKYHEALFLDADGYVAEGPGENIFLVSGKQLVTPRLGSILAGITRATVIELAKAQGIRVVQRNVSLDECYEAEELFFTGTAAEVTPIRSLNDHPIGEGKVGPITEQLQRLYRDLVTGKLAKYDHYLTYVNEPIPQVASINPQSEIAH
jgi:branched-chain amino acid aminotransferase